MFLFQALRYMPCLFEDKRICFSTEHNLPEETVQKTETSMKQYKMP